MFMYVFFFEARTAQFAANEKPAFIFIGNLALADLFVFITQMIVPHYHRSMKNNSATTRKWFISISKVIFEFGQSLERLSYVYRKQILK